MKFFLTVCLFTLMSCSLSAQNSFSRPLGVADFYIFEKQTEKTDNGTPVNKGSQVVVTGLIHKLNTFAGNHRFHIFEDEEMTSRVEIRVINDHEKVFEKIFKHLPPQSDMEFVNIAIRGKIKYLTVPVKNGNESVVYLELARRCNLRFINRKAGQSESGE